MCSLQNRISTRVGAGGELIAKVSVAVACLLCTEIFSDAMNSDSEMLCLLTAIVGTIGMMMLMQQPPNQKVGKKHDSEAKISDVLWRKQNVNRLCGANRPHADPVKGEMSQPRIAILEDEVSQLLSELEPTAECRKVVQELTALVQGSLDVTMPGAKATLFLSGPFWKNTPFVSSAPDIDVVISAPRKTLATFTHKHFQKQQGAPAPCLKWFLRVLVKHMLKDEGSFRWRRSCYSLSEAKVILVAQKLGTANHLVTFNLSLNAGQPVHNALLTSEASKFHPSIKGLLMLVRRWSKVRGMSQANMGYLSPYSWSLLVLHFLQVSGQPLLPPASCTKHEGRAVAAFNGERSNSVLGVAALFESFIRFYSQDFDWFHEEICITSGHRSADKGLLETSDKLRIQDPFNPERADLVALVTVAGMTRLKEEFHIASSCMEKRAPLNVLLQQWVPPMPERDSA